LKPAPEQERELERVLLLCRGRSNAALEQCITAWQRCRISISRYELKANRAEFPQYASVHSHILYPARHGSSIGYDLSGVFGRVQRGEKAGFPRFKGRNRFHSFTFMATGPPSIMGSWSRRKSAALLCAGLAQSRARPGWSRSVGKRTAGMSAS